MIILRHNSSFCKVETMLKKLTKNTFKFIVKTGFFAGIALFLTIAAQGAVVNGEGIERAVDTPEGERITNKIADPALKFNKITTIEEPEEAEQMTSQGSGSADSAPRPESTTLAPGELPSEPVFEDIGLNEEKESNGNIKFIAVGAVVVIIGIGVILGVAKNQGRD